MKLKHIIKSYKLIFYDFFFGYNTCIQDMALFEHPVYSVQQINYLLCLSREPGLEEFNRECPFDLEDQFLDHACREGNLELVHWRFESRNHNRPDQAYYFLLALCHDHHDIADYISRIYRGVNPAEFSMFACTTLIATLVENNNVDAMKKVVNAGFTLENDDEALYEIVSVTSTRAMIRLLHLQAKANLNTFADYFRELFLVERRYEVIEYFEENGISVNDVDTTNMDAESLDIYHESLFNYMRWVDLKTKTRTRALTDIQRKIFFAIFPKIYSKPKFVMAQASRSYDALFGEEMMCY